LSANQRGLAKIDFIFRLAAIFFVLPDVGVEILVLPFKPVYLFDSKISWVKTVDQE